MKLIPLHSLVLAVGPPSPGKAALLARFPDYEILSSARLRRELVGDERRTDLDSLVFAEFHRRAGLKLGLGERIIIDALHPRREDRVSLAHIGVQHGAPVFYLVHHEALPPGRRNERYEQGFHAAERDILRGDGIAEVIDARHDGFTIIAKPTDDDLLADLLARGFRGITVVGDVHGMYQAMLNAISWARTRNHYLVFLGDILDYGRQTLEVCDEVYRLVMRGEAEVLMGNHERKILRWLDQAENGRVGLTLSDGNRVTTSAVEALSPNERRRWTSRFRALMALSRQHRRIGRFLLVHGAAHHELWTMSERRLPRALEALAMFGEVDKTVPLRADGTPNRVHHWVEQIPAAHTVIVGHEVRSTMMPLTQKNKEGGSAIFLDTGSGKGGQLSTADLVFGENGLTLQNFNRH